MFCKLLDVKIVNRGLCDFVSSLVQNIVDADAAAEFTG